MPTGRSKTGHVIDHQYSRRGMRQGWEQEEDNKQQLHSVSISCSCTSCTTVRHVYIHRNTNIVYMYIFICIYIHRHVRENKKSSLQTELALLPGRRRRLLFQSESSHPLMHTTSASMHELMNAIPHYKTLIP